MSYKQCRTEQTSSRQRRMEEGLLNAMLNQRYEDISISDLCDQMQIPRKSFYRYFTSKDGALHALVDHRLMEYESRPERRDVAVGSLRDLTGFFEYWHAQKPLLDALAKSGLSQILVQRAIQGPQAELVIEIRGGDSSQTYKRFASAFISCGLVSAVIRWHHEGYRQTPAEMAEMTHRLLSRPLSDNLRL